MEPLETGSSMAIRKSSQQPFDKRLITHILSLVEQGVPKKVLVEQYGTRTVRKDYSVTHKRSVVITVYYEIQLRIKPTSDPHQTHIKPTPSAHKLCVWCGFDVF